MQLTDSQRHVLDNLSALVAETGRAPTNIELATRAGISTGHVSNVLNRLADLGAVEAVEVNFTIKRKAYFPKVRA